MNQELNPAQKVPCICGKIQRIEGNLICGECWDNIPPAKKSGYEKLDPASVEHFMASEQIMRIAKRNSSANH